MVVFDTHIDRTGLSWTTRPSSSRRRHHFRCLRELLKPLGNDALSEPSVQEGRLEKIEMPRVERHLQNIVLAKQLAQFIGDEIVVDGAAGRGRQIPLTRPDIVRRMIDRGLSCGNQKRQ